VRGLPSRKGLSGEDERGVAAGRTAQKEQKGNPLELTSSRRHRERKSTSALRQARTQEGEDGKGHSLRMESPTPPTTNTEKRAERGSKLRKKGGGER